MKLRLARKALAEAKRLKTWWRENRPAAPDLFEEELNAALDRIAAAPNVGTLYEQGKLGASVRRVLLPKTKNHVYYAVHDNEIVVVSIWGAPKRRGPQL
jgi:plasmid stabilization system protein ParE